MGNIFNMKKLGGIAVGAMLLLGTAVPSAHAQSTTDLQAQIQALLAQIAALQAQIAGGSSASSYTFTRDLTVGSTGADVTALQNFLISKGHVIPAGATGYFGGQTRAALAAYQAANGIAPAAGYFGPITRAKVNASAGTGGSGTGMGTGSGSGALRGGEAYLTDFELNREQSSGNEGEEEVEAATVEFDVEDGDVRVERLELTASSTNSALNQQPWRYIERVIILADGKEIAEKDVDTRRDWDETRGVYRLTLTGLNHVVREGDRAELTIAFDIRSTIDTADLAQEFALSIGDRGIRAVDSEGIQHYIGDEDETVTFGFNEEESGDLRIRTNSDDPDASTLIADDSRESDEYTVFVFDIENDEEVDTLITDMVIDVTSSLDADDVIRRATLVVGREEFAGEIGTASIEFDDIDFELEGDERETFELVIRLVRNAPDATLRFSIDDADITAEGVASGDDADVSGSATSETHTVAMTGINVTSKSTDADVNKDNNLGTFHITFAVEALEDDVYIYRGAAAGDDDATPFSGMASTTGVAYTVFVNGVASTTLVGDSALLQSTADRSGDYFLVREGQTKEFTLTVALDPQTATTDLYYVELDAVRFDTETASGTGDDTVHLVPNTRGFETNAVSISGT